MRPLPSNLQSVVDLFENQPENVRELFQYAIAMLMCEDGKAKLVGTEYIDNLEYLTFETVAGDVFDILKPQVDEALLDFCGDIKLSEPAL